MIFLIIAGIAYAVAMLALVALLIDGMFTRKKGWKK